MKRIIIFSTVLFVSLTALGQTNSAVFNGLISNYQELEGKYRKNYDEKNYTGTETILKNMLSLLSETKLSNDEISEFKPMIDNVKASTYYNLACTNSLLNKKKEAINAFEKSIEFGWSDYRHVLSDSDLDNIRDDKKFKTLLESIKQFDKLVILQNSNGYQKENNDSLPKFTYQSAENNNLQQVRNFFNLDSIAGNGDEISKIINLMMWVHDNIGHHNSYALCEFTSIDIYNYSKSNGKGVNCRHLAITLNEMYLSIGLKSRYVTCMPKDKNDQDCHVINCVWVDSLQKWIWIDPSFAAFVKDENGVFLSISEVRERLIDGRPLILNEDANYTKAEPTTKEWYLDYYMAKNLYWFNCVDFSRFNAESRYRYIENKYVALLPLGFEIDVPQGVINPKYVTHDPGYFWQKP